MAYVDQIEVDGVVNELQDSTARQQIEELSEVAHSGDYNDLLNKPDLSGFITRSVNDLVNYYTKTETYTKTEVNNLVNAIKQFTYEVVATLPTASASTMYKIYLVPATTTETQNIKDEYITIQSGSTYSWEQIGSTAVDLSGYSTTEQMNAAIANALTNYYTKTSIDEIVATLVSITDFNAYKQDANTGIAYDVSALHPTSGVSGGSTYASLSAALAVIPQNKRKGGMTVKFVLTSDNKYVQYRLMLSTFTAAQFTNAANWQGVDDEPTVGSNNLVKSGGVADGITNVKNSLSLLSGHNEFQFYYDGTGGGEHSSARDKVRVNVKSGDVLTYKFIPVTGNYTHNSLRIYFYGENGENRGSTPIFTPNTETTFTIARDDISFIGVYFYKGSAGIYELDYSYKSLEERLSENLESAVSNIEANEIKGWILAESFVVRSVTRNIGGDVTSANVTWPDNTNGALAITRDSKGDVSQVVATYGEDSFTLAVTRNSGGDVTKTVLTKN